MEDNKAGSVKKLTKRILGIWGYYGFPVALVACVLAIAIVAFSLIGLFFGIVTDELIFLFYLLMFVTLMVSLLSITIGYYSFKSTQTFITAEYYELLRSFRNDISHFEMQYDDTPLTDEMKVIVLEKVSGWITKALDHLVKTVNYVSGNSISASVKLVDYEDDGMKNSPLDCFVRTFSRDSKSMKVRYERDRKEKTAAAQIRENTDFSYFFTTDTTEFQDSVFYQGDLVHFRKILGYDNSNKDWRNYYRGTAVAPIRIRLDHIDVKCNKDDGYYILGFLCIDSLSTKVFIHRKRILYACILKSYAALLFHMLYFYQKVLKNEPLKVVDDISYAESIF